MSARIMDETTPTDLAQLGARLAQLRAERQWTLDDVAQKLHLPIARVQGLESANNGLESPIYLKGFYKSYARLLGVPESSVDNAFVVASPEPVLLPAAGAVARRVSWLERYKWAGTYAVGTALALTAVNWLVSNTPQLGIPDAAPLPVVSKPVQEPPPASEPVTDSVPPAVIPEPPMIASLSPFSAREESPAVTPDGAAALELRFDQDSWVEVIDGAGERLVYQVVRAGEQRTFSDGGPFSVRIGNVRGVRVAVDGRDLPMDDYTRGNVARFEVARGDGGWQAQSRSNDSNNG
jgi:cytoskeleton protein RodZ